MVRLGFRISILGVGVGSGRSESLNSSRVVWQGCRTWCWPRLVGLLILRVWNSSWSLGGVRDVGVGVAVGALVGLGVVGRC